VVRVGVYVPKPYPLDWPRRLDFATPLGLQVSRYCNAAKLEVYHIVCETSVKSAFQRPSGDIKTEFGVLKKHPVDRDKLVYIKDTAFDPGDKGSRVLITQEEVLEDVAKYYSIEYVGEFPDIIIKERGVVEKILKELEDNPKLQGSEEIYYYQKSSGNFTKSLRRKLGIRVLSDPYYFVRSELWGLGVIPMGQSHPILKKIRSVLRTVTLWTDAVGWGSLDKDTLTTMESSLMAKHYSHDLGMPLRVTGRADGTLMEAQIYRLLRRSELYGDVLIALEAL
jgi:hypothetical protein